MNKEPNVLVIQEGTQDNVEDLLIGVSNIWDGSASLSLSRGDYEERQRITVHSTLNFQGYTIELVKIEKERGNGSVILKVAGRSRSV